MKKILIIGSSQSSQKNNPSILADAIRSEELEAQVVYWEEMVFSIAKDNVSITFRGENLNTNKPDLVIALGWYKNGKNSIYRDVAFSLALFLKHHEIRFWNSEMGAQRSVTKLSAMMQLALEGISVPATHFSLTEEKVVHSIDMPYVAKAAAASRGVSNFLIRSDDDLKQVYESDAKFIIQPYLENDHDLRIICFGGKPALVLKRSRQTDAATHLNNTSQGATAVWLELSEIDPRLLTLSEKICKITNREMAGIDFIPDVSSDLGYSCLEVNPVPQLTSGTDFDKKLETFAHIVRDI